MLTNLLLATIFIFITIGFLLSFDKLLNLINILLSNLFRFASHAKLFTSYMTRAYMRYRKATQQQCPHLNLKS